MSHLLSFISRILFVLVLAMIPYNASCRPLRSVKQSPNNVTQRTIPDGAIFSRHTGLTLRQIQTRTVVTPSHLAAGAIAEFYLRVLANALFDQSLGRVEQSNIFYRQGSFTLALVADTLEKSIPWDFVVNFAHEMVGWTNRGYLGTFDSGYWNDEGTLGVFAGFRVNEVILPF